MSYLKKKGNKYYLYQVILLFLIIFISLLVGRFVPFDNYPAVIIASVFLPILCSVLLVLIFIAHKRESDYLKGQKGEDYVEQILKKNSIGYISDIKLTYGNMDFLVVGSNGIYGIEVKNIGGILTFDREKLELLQNGLPFEKNYIKQVKGNCLEVHSRINEKLDKDIYVQPVLIFTNQGVDMHIDEKEVDNVYVLKAEGLIGFLKDSQKQNVELEEREQEQIRELFKK